MTLAGAESLRGADGRVRPGWATAFASAVGMAFGPSVLQVMSLAVFAPYLRQEFGWTIVQISLAATLLAVMTMVASSLQGLLVDRYGARRIILPCQPLFGLGYAGLSLMSGSLWQFYLVWALLPLLGVGLWPASWVKATSSWFDRRLGLAIGVATVGIGLGATLFPLLIHWLAEAAGWRSAFAIIGIAAILISWPVALRYVHDRVRDGVPGAMVEREAAPARASTFWLLFAAFLLLGVYSVSILLHLLSILEDNGMARGTAVGAQSVLGAMMIAGRLGSGVVIDRVSVRIVLPVLAMATVAALLALVAGIAGAGAIVAAGLLGLLIGAEIDMLGFVVKRYFGLRRYGTIYGLLFAVFQLGGAAGVLAMGRMREASGGYAGGLIALAVACTGAALLFALLGPYRYGHEPALPGAEATDLPVAQRA